MITIKEATTKAELKEYIQFPFTLYKDNPNWIPPLINDELTTFDKTKNPIKYFSEEEKLAYKRSQYPKLTRYQFMRGLLENGYKSSDIEAKIMLIEDEYTRELTMLGFKDAGYFERNDSSIGVMRDVLGKTDLEIDEFWEQCLLF